MGRFQIRKTWAIHFFVLAFILSFTPLGWAKEMKIGYVDVAKVFDSYQKTKDNETKLQTAGKKKEEERDALVHEVRRLKDEQALLAEDAREKKQEAIDVKVKELADFDAAARKDLGEQRNTMVREIFKDIDDLVQTYGEKKGFDMVFNDRVLLYRSTRLEVTNDILNELNRNYQANKGKK